MPAAEPVGDSDPTSAFPPIPQSHILNCQYGSWFPTYTSVSVKSRVISLNQEFLDYLYSPSIILASKSSSSGSDNDLDDDVVWAHGPSSTATDNPRYQPFGSSGSDDDSDSESEDEATQEPPNRRFPAIHKAIQDTIAELGGSVAPKFNWSAPRDAAHMSRHQNTMLCTEPNDIYLLLKSSDFIMYDLERAFANCTPSLTFSASSSSRPFTPTLVLRSFFRPRTSLEFRCFVKERALVAICQRDLKHYSFLENLQSDILARIKRLFNHRLRYSFPDRNFVFDVYIPDADPEAHASHGSLADTPILIDISPWAPQTDSLLFGWDELLAWPIPTSLLAVRGDHDPKLSVSDEEDEDEEGEEEEEDIETELRLVPNDPAAENFSAAPYSAHKMPKDVVDASQAGEGGMRDFARQWREMVNYRAEVAAVKEAQDAAGKV